MTSWDLRGRAPADREEMLGGAGGRGGSRVKCRSGRARMLPRVGRIPDRRVARPCRRSSSALSCRGYLSIYTKVRDKPWPSVRAAQEGLSRSSLLFHVSVWHLCGLQRGTCLEAHRLSSKTPPGQRSHVFHFSVPSPHTCPWLV